MRDYVIMSDSCCDLTAEEITELGLTILPLTYTVDGVSYKNDVFHPEMTNQAFFQEIREGADCSTSAVSVGEFHDAMRPILASGKDILCVSFSSALSTTYQSAAIAAGDLRSEFPEAKIFVVDFLCASLGQGLLLYLCAQQKREGRSIGEVRAYAEATKGNICHWFTVDDLNHLKRGGRISAATALFGTMLSIKPVMHVDDGGHLTPVSKARGRKASLLALVDQMEKNAVDSAHGPVFISHGDCEGDALLVADEVVRRFGNNDIHLNYVGPVIGNHSGPGTVALFFVGHKR